MIKCLVRQWLSLLYKLRTQVLIVCHICCRREKLLLQLCHSHKRCDQRFNHGVVFTCCRPCILLEVFTGVDREVECFPTGRPVTIYGVFKVHATFNHVWALLTFNLVQVAFIISEIEFLHLRLNYVNAGHPKIRCQ